MLYTNDIVYCTTDAYPMEAYSDDSRGYLYKKYVYDVEDYEPERCVYCGSRLRLDVKGHCMSCGGPT